MKTHSIIAIAIYIVSVIIIGNPQEINDHAVPIHTEKAISIEAQKLEKIPEPTSKPLKQIAAIWYSNLTRPEWIQKIEICESSGNPGAINIIDVDGTSSYGLYQFKPGTFAMYLKRYGLTGDIMDGAAQRAVFAKMIDDPKVRWETEFPDCVRKHGRPPRL